METFFKGIHRHSPQSALTQQAEWQVGFLSCSNSPKSFHLTQTKLQILARTHMIYICVYICSFKNSFAVSLPTGMFSPEKQVFVHCCIPRNYSWHDIDIKPRRGLDVVLIVLNVLFHVSFITAQ